MCGAEAFSDKCILRSSWYDFLGQEMGSSVLIPVADLWYGMAGNGRHILGGKNGLDLAFAEIVTLHV